MGGGLGVCDFLVYKRRSGEWWGGRLRMIVGKKGGFGGKGDGGMRVWVEGVEIK